MRQYGRNRTHHGGHVAPDGEQPFDDTRLSMDEPSKPSPIPVLTDPGLAALCRAVIDCTAAVRELTAALERGTVEATATIGDEVLRLEVKA